MSERSLVTRLFSALMVAVMVVTTVLTAVPQAEAATGVTTADTSQSMAISDQPAMVESLIGPMNDRVVMQTGGVTLWMSRTSAREGDFIQWRATGDFSAPGMYLLNGPCSLMYEGPSMCGRYFRSDVGTTRGEFSGSFYMRDVTPGPANFQFHNLYSSTTGSANVPFTVLPKRSPSIQVSQSVLNGGTQVTVTGAGFSSWGDRVDLRWGGQIGYWIKGVEPNQDTTFTTSFMVPNGVTGSVQIFASQSIQLSDRTWTTRSAFIWKTVKPNYRDAGTLRLTPATGPSGLNPAVYGTGYEPDELVDIRWQSDTGPIIGTIRVRSDGTYLGRITTRSGPPGSNKVYATGRTSLHRSMAWYQITSSTPTMVLKSSNIQTQSGAVITISGSGYQPNELVQIRWISQSGILLGTVRANASGAITGKITVPQAVNKNYQIFATGLSSKRYGTVGHRVRNYTVAGRTLVSPNFGQSGTVVTVTGSGFAPGERVELRWGSFNGPMIGAVIADANGNYRGRVTTRSAAPGPAYIVAVGTSSLRYNSGTYTITTNATSGQLNVSHVNVRPGYVILTNGTGWTPGQRLELRWNGANGQLLGGVTVRANGSWSGRITIPTSARPGTYYLYAITPSGFTSVRITVAGTSIQSSMLNEDMKVEEETTPTPTTSPTPAIIGTPVGTPSVEPTEESVGTPSAEPTEEPVGTPSIEPTEETGEIPDGTPTAEPTEAISGTPEGSDEPTDAEEEISGTPESSDEPTIIPTEEPAPVVLPKTIVVVDQHGAQVQDVCISVTSLASGEVANACDATNDGVSDGRVLLLPGIRAGEYRIEVSNLPKDVVAPAAQIYFLSGEDTTDFAIQLERVPTDLPGNEPDSTNPLVDPDGEAATPDGN